MTFFNRGISTLIAATLPFAALALEMPRGATEVYSGTSDNALYHVPVAAFADGAIPVTTGEGTQVTSVWHLPNTALSTNQLAVSLRDQLKAEGYEIILDCRNEVCGGFDFRYGLSLVQEPLMHVDLGDFRYISAEMLGEGNTSRFATIMVSNGPGRAYIQIERSGAVVEENSTVVVSTRSRDVQSVLEDAATDVGAILLQEGYFVLEDVRFETGSPEVANRGASSLKELAEFLMFNPDKTVALVGHTDSVGSLSGNLALSRSRAQSVLELLVADYNVPQSQLEADGVGYLAPRTSNLTDDGRTENRRVEVILTSTR